MANRKNKNRNKNKRNIRKPKIDQTAISKEVKFGLVVSGILFIAGIIVFLLLRRGMEPKEGVQAEETASFLPIWVSFLPFIFISQRKEKLTKKERNLIKFLIALLVVLLIAGIMAFLGFEMR